MSQTDSTGHLPRHCRWFQISLRALSLLLAVFAVWLGLEVRIVRERKLAREWLYERGGRENYDLGGWPIRRLLGDKPTASIYPPTDLTGDESKLLRAAFPEAYFFGRQEGQEPYDTTFEAWHPETIGQKRPGPRRLPSPDPLPALPRRPRFQVSLPTLVIMATFAIWLTYGLRWVRSRGMAIRHLKKVGGEIHRERAEFRPWRDLPLTLRLLRAEPICRIVVSKGAYSASDFDNLVSLFPEASVTQ